MAQTHETIHVVWAADEKYGAYAGIGMSSVAALCRGARICCHLLSDGVNRRDIERMQKLMDGVGGRLHVYDISERLDGAAGCVSKHHYSRAAFGRLFISEMLPKTISWVIYFDCDMFCVDNVGELWSLKESVPCLGAVRDLWIDCDREFKSSISLPCESTYYNTGTLLIPLETWRSRRIDRELMEMIARRRATRYPDQDAVNLLLGREITALPARWNVMVTSPEPSTLQTALDNAANIHFSGALKPWHLGYAALGGIGAEVYLAAKRRSHWRWMPPDPQIGRIRRKLGEVIETHREVSRQSLSTD